jgi:hypothetical protein
MPRAAVLGQVIRLVFDIESQGADPQTALLS